MQTTQTVSASFLDRERGDTSFLLNGQTTLHAWAAANQMTFDPSKESMHVLHRGDDAGGNFKILGCTYDTQLKMQSAFQEIAREGRWRLRVLLRPRRFYNMKQLLGLYKSHILCTWSSAERPLMGFAGSHRARCFLRPVARAWC